jgi:hypothetical protein
MKNKWSAIFVFLLICLSAFHLVFAIRTNTFFSLDDFAVLNYISNHSTPEMIGRFLSQGDIWGFKKILGYLNFSLIFFFLGTDPTAFVANNYLLHTVNIILIFLISRYLTKDSAKSFFVSVIANSLYLTYFSNIHEYLVVFFVLLSALLYLQSRIYLSLTVFILALLTKEIAFTLPFFLLASSYYLKQKPSLKLHWVILTIYIIYQLSVGPSRLSLPANSPYATELSFSVIFNNLKFYLPLWFPVLTILASFVSKKINTLPFLFVSVLSLSPALLLVNRQETYYLYLPLLYFAIHLSTLLPKFKFKTLPVYLFVFVLLGGRKILPPIARQNYPNWQKVSIQNVVNRVENKVEEKEIDLSDIHLERDTKLMLGSRTLSLFVKKELSSKHNFVYNPDTFTIHVSDK